MSGYNTTLIYGDIYFQMKDKNNAPNEKNRSLLPLKKTFQRFSASTLGGF